jgi:hypothetical protein
MSTVVPGRLSNMSVTVVLDDFLVGRGLLLPRRSLVIKLPHLIPASSSFIVRPIMMMFIVLSIFIIQVWSQTITVNTTSGRLLGTQADGGMYSVYTLSPYSPQLIHRTSGIIQGHCKIPTIACLE